MARDGGLERRSAGGRNVSAGCGTSARLAAGLLCLLVAYLGVVKPVGAAVSALAYAAAYLKDVHDVTDLAERPGVRDLVERLTGVESMSAIAQVVDRVMLHDFATPTNGERRLDAKPLYGLVLDVSHSGEAGLVLKRVAQRPPKDRGYAPIVVDVGANDGVLSSNSYNLVQTGWSSVLVEPNPDLLSVARKMQGSLVDPWRDGGQRICYVQAAMSGGAPPTRMQLRIGADVVAMESSLVRGGEATGGNAKREAVLAKLRGERTQSAQRTIEVDVLPARDVAIECDIPKRFGLLSVDAEGVGAEVLHDFLDEGFRPEFIIYEPLHNSEPWHVTKEFLERLGYRWVQRRGWNHLLEWHGADPPPPKL